MDNEIANLINDLEKEIDELKSDMDTAYEEIVKLKQKVRKLEAGE